MVQEAARIAMQRSRAKKVVTIRSPTPNRSRSLRTPKPKKLTPVVPPEVPKTGGGGGIADIGFHFIRTGSIVDSKAPSQLQLPVLGPQHQTLVKRREPGHVEEKADKKKTPEKQNTELALSEHKVDGEHATSKDRQDPKPDAIMMLAHLLVTVYLVLLGLACAWWTIVKPAFDQRSELWSRRRRQKSTWADIGIFAAASVFSIVAALVLACGVKTAWWISVWL
jgi:hypothetical protein